MLVTSVCCPKCNTTLAVPRPVPPGTPMDCPRCLLSFRTPRPKEGDAVLDEVEIIDEHREVIPTVEAVDDNKTATATGPRRKVPAAYRLADGTPRFRRRKQKPINWVAVGVGTGVGGMLIVGLLGLAIWLTTSGPGDDPLAFVPPSAQVVAGVRLGELARQVPAVARLVDGSGIVPAGASVKDDFGIDGRDLFDELTIALTADGTEVTLITKSRIPYDKARVTGRQQEGATKLTAYGRTYFRIDSPGSPIKSVYCPNNRVIVFSGIAAEPLLRPILKSDGKKRTLAGPVGELAGKLSTHIGWFATTPDGLRGPLAGTAAAADATPVLDELAVKAASVSAWAAIENGAVTVHCAAKCGSEDVARETAGKMKTESAKFFALLDAAALLPPALKSLAADLRATAKFAAQGEEAEATARVSLSTLEGLLTGAPRPAGGQP